MYTQDFVCLSLKPLEDSRYNAGVISLAVPCLGIQIQRFFFQNWGGGRENPNTKPYKKKNGTKVSAGHLVYLS